MGARPSLRRFGRHAETSDINLIPLMNVFCILIPFLLLSAVFVQLSIIDTNLPSAISESNKDEKTEKSPTPEVKKLNLTVLIRKDGFTLAGYGGVLTVNEGGEKPVDAKTDNSRTVIPMIEKKEGNKVVKEYDFVKFQEHLIKIKEAFPGHFSIIVLPESQVRYETIIKTLDFSREYKVEGEEQPRELFYNPVLAGGIS